ncbi:hypothetical protein BD413DRAFT_107398 [Trametes elegans]|nr:hypothetical protein BD413DRAFT_107398 [Trametes elegans]
MITLRGQDTADSSSCLVHPNRGDIPTRCTNLSPSFCLQVLPVDSAATGTKQVISYNTLGAACSCLRNAPRSVCMCRTGGNTICRLRLRRSLDLEMIRRYARFSLGSLSVRRNDFARWVPLSDADHVQFECTQAYRVIQPLTELNAIMGNRVSGWRHS